MLNTGIIIINEEGKSINHGPRMQKMMPESRKRSSEHMGDHFNMRSGHGMNSNTKSESTLDLNNLLDLEKDVNDVFSGKTITYQGQSPLLNQKVIAVGFPLSSDSNFNENSNLALFLISPITGLQNTAAKIRNLTLQITLIGIILCIIIAYFIARGIVNPISVINDRARKLADGNLNIRIKNLPNDEIGELGNSFNYLAQKLQENISELNEEKNKMQSMLISMREGVLGVSTNHKILLANPKIKEMLKLNNDIYQENAEKIFPHEVNSLINKIIDTVKPQKVEFKLKDKIYVLEGAPVFNNNSNLIGVILLARDVTQIRKLEQMRKLFVANASHELKTPLTSIQGYIEAILDGMVETEEKRKYLKKVLKETESMDRLIKDILNLSRLQSGQLEFNHTEFDLIKLFNTLIDNLKPKTGKRKIELNSPPEVIIKSDREKIKEIINNLLSNAIKFTEEKNGLIEINITEKPDHIKVEIADNGTGIPRSELTHIWERFYQVDRSRRPDREGTGLG
ncbi:MAG: histidine kinase dimerization/phospho-acceptor domain-containing protein, partial [Bacillota bacterium]